MPKISRKKRGAKKCSQRGTQKRTQRVSQTEPDRRSGIRYSINRKHKDSLFCLYFGSPEYKANAISLYNAVSGTDYNNADDFVIYTLSDAVYIKRKNDVAYLVANETLSLYEHQSTINPNVPIRGLMYYGELYSRYITENDLDIYRKSQVKIPAPQYIVFYNGTDDFPPRKKLRLSDAFKQPVENGDYEWTATVINIGKADCDARKNSKPLNDYMAFIEKVREYGKTTPITEAVDKAVDECIVDGIMAEFLLKHKLEVRMMCITEYNEELHLKTVRNEGWNECKIEGLEALVSTMKNFLPNFDALYQAIITNKIYKDITKEQVWEIYNSDK